MASYGPPRFPRPPMNRNYPRANFNMNPGVTRPPPQFLQRPPPMPFSSFSGSDSSTTQAPYMSRPRFPSFGETGFRNRPPIPEPIASSNLGPAFRTPDMKPSFMPPNMPQPVRSPGMGPTIRPPRMDPTPLNMGPNIRPPRMEPTPPRMGQNIRTPVMGPTMRPSMRAASEYSGLGSANVFPGVGPSSVQTNMSSAISYPNIRSASRFQNIRPPNMGSPLRQRYPGEISFERQVAPWQQQPPPFNPRSPFRNRPRSPFRNRPRSPFPSSAGRDVSFNKVKTKKRKTQKFRDKDERKLKEKEDGAEKPFSCDTCDRAFLSEDELHGHLSQHIKCDYAECKFEAHPKIVLIHKKMQHDTGYAEAISKLNTDQEIEKWREERRNRFPTAANILKRKAEQAEKEVRGEVLETKEFGKFKRRKLERKGMKSSKSHQVQFKKDRFRHRKFPRKWHNFMGSSNSGTAANVSASESDSDSDSHITLKTFLGISSLMECSELINSTNGNELETKKISSMSINYCESQKNFSNIRKKLSNESMESNQDLVVDGKMKECEKEVQSLNSNAFSHIDYELSETNHVTVKDEISDHELNEDLQKTECITVEDNFSHSFSPRSSSSVELLSENSVTEISSKTACYGSQSSPIFIESETFKSPNPGKLSKSISTSKLTDQKTAEESIMSGSKNNPIFVEDSDEEAPLEIPIVKTEYNETFSGNQLISDDDGPEILPIFRAPFGRTPLAKEESSNVSSVSQCDKAQESRRENRDSEKKSDKKYDYAPHRSTLLEKLLAPDIRHERNVILQCVRYIVKNNYFGVGHNEL